MPGATAPFLDVGRFFVSHSSCSARFVWKRSTISITLRRFISLPMAAPTPFAWLGTTATFSTSFFVFMVIPFVVGFLKTVYTCPCAELTIHISESWLVAWHFEETVRNPDLVLFFRRGLETELRDMCLDQVGKKQMRER
jgi:hypothetical protein